MTPGLQWVSLMLLTRIGWAGRHWALPFLTALVVSARYDRRKGRRHKTFTDYAQQMLVVQDRRADLCPLRIRVVFRGMV